MDAQAPDEDPTIAAMMAAAERRSTVTVDGVEATVNGAGTVVSLRAVAEGLQPGPAGLAAAEALTRAWTQAREAVRADMRAVPGLSPRLRAMLDGDEVPDDQASASAQPRRWTGSKGDASVTFDTRTQRFQEVYLPSIEESALADVVRAANRALTLAETDGAESASLDEQLDEHLERLDERMEAIEGRLDDVFSTLDRIERDLG